MPEYGNVEIKEALFPELILFIASMNLIILNLPESSDTRIVLSFEDVMFDLLVY